MLKLLTRQCIHLSVRSVADLSSQAHAIEAAFRAVAQTASPKQVEILDAIRNPETALKILNDKQPSTSAAKSRPVLSVFSKSLGPLAKSGSDVAATALGSMDFMLSMSMVRVAS